MCVRKARQLKREETRRHPAPFPQLDSFEKKLIDVESANQLSFRNSGFHKWSFGDEVRLRQSVEQGSGLSGGLPERQPFVR
jgi:hypothetical protein